MLPKRKISAKDLSTLEYAQEKILRYLQSISNIKFLKITPEDYNRYHKVEVRLILCAL